MRASIVISSHNEGDLLLRTVRSCAETTEDLDCEIVIADDASTDGSLRKTVRRFPNVRVVRSSRRRGVSATKDSGGRNARGEVLVFLDAHCKPEPRAIELLVSDVERHRYQSVFMPAVPVLDTKNWRNSRSRVGVGYRLNLADFSTQWGEPTGLRRRGWYYDSPALCGCCVAVGRKLYERLRGFDPHMQEYGAEDIDFGLKAWMLGHPILVDPVAWIGHRFNLGTFRYPVQDHHPIANFLRSARKILSDSSWKSWLGPYKAIHSARLWAKAWKVFSSGNDSLKRERNYLMRQRIRDEHEYAKRFGIVGQIADVGTVKS